MLTGLVAWLYPIISMFLMAHGMLGIGWRLAFVMAGISGGGWGKLSTSGWTWLQMLQTFLSRSTHHHCCGCTTASWLLLSCPQLYVTRCGGTENIWSDSSVRSFNSIYWKLFLVFRCNLSCSVVSLSWQLSGRTGAALGKHFCLPYWTMVNAPAIVVVEWWMLWLEATDCGNAHFLLYLIIANFLNAHF